MRLAYILDTFPSVSETFILREVLSLRKRGVDVQLFALRSEDSSAIDPVVRKMAADTCFRASLSSTSLITGSLRALLCHPYKVLRLLALSIWHHMASPVSLLWLLRNFAVALCFAHVARKKEVDHIHAHFLHIPADIAWVISEVTGIPFSVSAHAHDIYTLNNYCYEHVVNQAQFIATCTEDGRSVVQNMFPDLKAGKVVTLRHGLFLENYEVTNPDGRMILCVGRLEPKKGFVHAVNACRELRDRGEDFNCIIAGRGSRQAMLAESISNHGLSGRVDLVGELSSEEVNRLYRKAAMLVVPSVIADNGDRDGLPNVILEAQASGLPVVATAVGAIGEFVEDGVNGFVVPAGNSTLLADRIAELMNDLPQRQRMGLAGRAKVEKHFRIDDNIQWLLTLIERGAGDAGESNDRK
ncbi:MAG: glycosyltransferase family 4 protein [Kiritimatiellia bacterium]|jgi:glycosyltransferase involved in cell wall biosynthesis|nr:glycosyltransferase family 4 protein [Kiritimatiellia bacterium]